MCWIGYSVDFSIFPKLFPKSDVRVRVKGKRTVNTLFSSISHFLRKMSASTSHYGGEEWMVMSRHEGKTCVQQHKPVEKPVSQKYFVSGLGEKLPILVVLST
ncbi:unnamed protein product [Hapterophycus canaliculatus]